MSSYIPITRKYRPKTFREVLGQEATIQVLKNSLGMERVGHAYLFSGIRGTGKTTLARIFAKALNCSTRNAEGEPCNACSSCQEITAGGSLDVIEIDGASNRGIDDVRQITESAAYAPSRGGYKIYIIDEVHMLTKEAFNALLKTLEEPPASVKFFFATTEPHKIPATVLSRCQRFALKPLLKEQIMQKLASICDAYGVPADSEALHSIASLAHGSVRDAESLLEKMLLFTNTTLSDQNVHDVLGLPAKEDYQAFNEAAKEHNLSFAFTLVEKLKSEGKEPKHFLEGLAEHLRFHLRQLLTGKPTLLQKDFLIKGLDLVVTALTSKESSYLGLEVLLLKLLRLQKRIHPEALVERLEQLEKNLQQPVSQSEAALEEKVKPIPTPLQKAAPQPAVAPEPTPLPKATPQPTVVPEPMPKAAPQPVVAPEPMPLPKATPQPAVVPEPMPKAAPQPVVAPEPMPLPKATPQPVVAPEPMPLPKAQQQSNPKPEVSQGKHAHYDTLLRFTGVEFNGSVKKEATRVQ